MSDNTYDTYIKWKGWESDSVPRAEPSQRDMFLRELKRANAHPPGRLLEIGFGKGEMLLEAKEAGFDVVGVEIILELVHRVKEAGMEAVLADLSDSECELEALAGGFDVVVALDVLEHLDVNASKIFLGHVAELLRPGGSAVLRFPNGMSPFGFMIYNGDCTHRQAFTLSRMEQLITGQPLRVKFFGNSVRSINWKSRIAVMRPLLFALRNLNETLTGWLYYGRRIPMDMCATCILVKDE